MKQTKIEFSVTSYEGDTKFSMLPKEALAKIKKLEKEESKWLFINGEVKKSEMITEKDLINAMKQKYEVVMVNAIAGGSCCDEDDYVPTKPVEINFDVLAKTGGSIVINLDTNEYRTQVNISVSKSAIYDVLHDRENIVTALSKKLDELAESQVSDLRKALRV